MALQTTWSASQYSKLNKILIIHQQMGMAGFQAHLIYQIWQRTRLDARATVC